MSQISKRYLDILKQIDEEHNAHSTLTRHSKVLIVDGLNTFIRSWSISPNLSDNGDHVGGIVGALKSIGYAIRTINPTRTIVVFDGKGGSTSRQSIHPEYKADRSSNKLKMRLNRTYSDLMNKEEEYVSMKRQMVGLGELLSTLPITIMIYDGVEADDVMAYIATQLRKDGEQNIIMSSDMDFIQLVNKDVTVYSPTKKKIYTIDETMEEFGIHPYNFINYKMINGDKSDNLKGIKGIGLKTIRKMFPMLIEEREYSIDELVEYAENGTTSTNMYKLFLNNVELCERNRKVMQLSVPEFSTSIRLKILDRYNEPTPKFDKGLFLTYCLKNRMLDNFKDANSWLNSTFTYLTKFR